MHWIGNNDPGSIPVTVSHRNRGKDAGTSGIITGQHCGVVPKTSERTIAPMVALGHSYSAHTTEF